MGAMAERVPYGAWPRLLNTEQAAAYVGTSRHTFLEEVDDGVWPAPVALRGREFWDRSLLDQALDDRSGSADEQPGEAEALRAIHDHRTT